MKTNFNFFNEVLCNDSFGTKLFTYTTTFLFLFGLCLAIEHYIGVETIIMCGALCLFTSLVIISTENKHTKLTCLLLFGVFCIIYAVLNY